ncbi:MAG: VOC family protein [Verrucomicrobiales bacterium]|nr:VOC family protein [Verrucomicrobiales bacterium]
MTTQPRKAVHEGTISTPFPKPAGATAKPLELPAFDHVHVYVTDRVTAETWYRDVLHLYRSQELEFWSSDGGPLMLRNSSGSIHIALFERPAQTCRSVIAFRVGAAGYESWKTHLESALPGQVSEQDHEVSLSLYFRDPDGNPYELTTYEVGRVNGKLPGGA